MSLTFTILGCGSSGGVPRLGGGWGSCDPKNPKNRRRRCSALVRKRGPKGKTAVLIDTPPDMREQLIDARTNELDAVVITHDHADHTHGIDDLRAVSYAKKKRIDLYFDAPTATSLQTRFAYCFEKQIGSGYNPFLIANTIEPGDEIKVAGEGGKIVVRTFSQRHGDIETIGLRIGNLAYSPDVSDLDETACEALTGLDVWIVDALRHTPHPSHFSVKAALDWIERLKPKRAILTHMTPELDYADLKQRLPANVEPAYDGMTIEFT